MTRRVSSLFISLVFIVTMIFPPHCVYAQNVANLPAPGAMITPSAKYYPTIVTGITIYPDNPLKFDFIIDSGDENLQDEELRNETKKLINYFLATLTVPEDEMWVNLSPYEKDRIVADGLGVTEMGRDMLAQDYMLKQLTASLMYPEERIGSEFWKRVYEKAQARFGTTAIPTNTFSKIWIVPENAVVYVSGNNVFVSKSYLKVMLEEDYLAMESHIGGTQHGLGELTKNDIEQVSKEAKEAIREILIPEIEREVNEGKNFANLRQIYNSMILATWYKKNLKESVLGNVYMDANKVNGIDLEDKRMKEKIYNQYVEAFNKGVYDYIREDYDPATQEIIPRKYFSGGLLGHRIETIDEGAEEARKSVRQGLEDDNLEYIAGLRLDMTNVDGDVIDPEQSTRDGDKAMLGNPVGLRLYYPQLSSMQRIREVLKGLEFYDAKGNKIGKGVSFMGWAGVGERYYDANGKEIGMSKEFIGLAGVGARYYDANGKEIGMSKEFMGLAGVGARYYDANGKEIGMSKEFMGPVHGVGATLYDADGNELGTVRKGLLGQTLDLAMLAQEVVIEFKRNDYFGLLDLPMFQSESITITPQDTTNLEKAILRIAELGNEDTPLTVGEVKAVVTRALDVYVQRNGDVNLAPVAAFEVLQGIALEKKTEKESGESSEYPEYFTGSRLPFSFANWIRFKMDEGREAVEASIDLARADNAMPVHGGIDLNPNELNLTEQGQTTNFTMDNAMFQTLQPNSVQGITPVLIHITPITNFVPLLGLSDEKESENQQSS